MGGSTVCRSTLHNRMCAFCNGKHWGRRQRGFKGRDDPAVQGEMTCKRLMQIKEETQ